MSLTYISIHICCYITYNDYNYTFLRVYAVIVGVICTRVIEGRWKSIVGGCKLNVNVGTMKVLQYV